MKYTTKQPMKRCYVCKSTNHEIEQCNDDRIIRFAIACIDKITRINDVDNIQLIFKKYLIEKISTPIYTPFVVGFAILKCGYIFDKKKSTENVIECLKTIIYYFASLMEARRIGILEGNNVHGDDTDANEPTINYALEEELEKIDISHILIPAFQINDICELTFHYYLAVSGNRIYQAIQCTPIYRMSDDLTSETECGICYETMPNSTFVKLSCGHAFCYDCTIRTVHTFDIHNHKCAFCRIKPCTVEFTSMDRYADFCNEVSIL